MEKSSDYLLIEKYKNTNNPIYVEQLIKQYEDLIKKNSSYIYYRYTKYDYSITLEDVEQDVKMAFITAINKTDLTRVTNSAIYKIFPMFTFQYKIYKNKECTKIRNKAIGFTSYYYIIKHYNTFNEMLFSQVNDSVIISKFIDGDYLNRKEKVVATLFFSGKYLKDKEIAEVIGVTDASICTYKDSIKEKFKNYLDNITCYYK